MLLTSGYIYIPVSDLRRSAEWYGEHLGLKIVHDDPLFIELGTESGIRVLLITNENGITSQMKYAGGPQASYGFTVSDIDSAYRHLADKGIRVGKISKYSGVSFSFHDPDGNVIELWSDYPAK